MPTGYDARAKRRDTFAGDTGAAPVQTSTGASADSRGAQVVGGESIGGTAGGQYSQPGYQAAGLGKFFGEIMEPEIQRKQREKFFKGFLDAQAGKALSDASDPDNPLNKAFGPSGYAQGAQFYHGQRAINEWQQSQIADMDNLKRLAPDDLAKHLTETSQAVLTGDPWADDIIQSGILEAQAPLMQTITKERVAWQQETIRSEMSGAANTAAGSLQQIASRTAALGQEVNSEPVVLSGQRFLGMMQQPAGMTDENYKDFLYDFARNNMATGNFYAVELLKQNGLFQVFDDDKQRKLEDDYDRYAKRTLDDAAANPAMLDKLLTLDARIAQTEIDGEDAASVKDVVSLYGEINTTLRNATGLDMDYFDAEDIRSSGGKVIGAIVSRYKRLESRRQQIEDRNWTAEQRRAEKQQEAADKVAAVKTAWATGDVTAAVASGMSQSDFDTVAMQDFIQKDYGTIARAYVRSGYVSKSVATQVQAVSRAGIGETYTKATQSAYELWQQFNQVNPELAGAYFGEYDQAFEVFDQLVTTSGPEIAFRDAFASVGRYSAQSIPPSIRREFDEQFDALLADKSAGWAPWKWQNYTLNGPGQEELRLAIGSNVAVRSQNSPRSMEQLATQAYNDAIRTGRFEQYGVFGWRNPKATKPLGQLLNLQGSDAHAVVQAQIAQRLKTLGVSGTDSVRVIRRKNDLLVEYVDDNGESKFSTITYGTLQDVAQRYVEKRRNRSTRRPKDYLRGGNPAGVPSL